MSTGLRQRHDPLPAGERPLSGQRAVYNAVLRVKNEATKLLRLGTMLADYHKGGGQTGWRV